MKSRIITGLALSGVIVTGAAAAGVNTQALWPSSGDSISLASDSQPTDTTVVPAADETPVPHASEVEQIAADVAAAERAAALAAATPAPDPSISSDDDDDADDDADDDSEDESEDDEDDDDSDSVETD